MHSHSSPFPSLSHLDASQQSIWEKIENAHQHDDYLTDIHIAEKLVLKNFRVNSGVLRPEITVSSYLAQWLYQNRELYAGKKVLDMGCGTGIQGIVMGHGVSEVWFSDVDERSWNNTNRNILTQPLGFDSFEYTSSSCCRFHKSDTTVLPDLESITSTCGNLFDPIATLFDVIVFNHPFFYHDFVLHDFLSSAHVHLNPNGKIIMPYFIPAGSLNDPGVQGLKYGYTVNERLLCEVSTGVQQGLMKIYELVP